MPKPVLSESKLQSLKEQGALNPHPEKVTNPMFMEGEFFDPYDLIQVKYEMLRRVQKEGVSVSGAVAAFGFSRTAFYRTQKCFAKAGLAGLLPQMRGPKGAHKLSGEVMSFIDQALSENPSLRAPVLAKMVEGRFGFPVHPRSIERALSRQKKPPR
jgi:transposase